MATRKPRTPAKPLASLPAGVTVQMLARALFLDSLGEHGLPPDGLQQRWKAEAMAHHKRAARMVTRLARMTAKSAA